jgi:hypothetical protein
MSNISSRAARDATLSERLVMVVLKMIALWLIVVHLMRIDQQQRQRQQRASSLMLVFSRLSFEKKTSERSYNDRRTYSQMRGYAI